MKSKLPLLIILGGYISNLGFYFIWYYKKYYYLFYGRGIPNTSIVEISVVVYAITFLYLLLFLFILFFRSFKKPWPCFSLVSIIILLTLFSVSSGYYAKYHDIFFKRFNQSQFERDKDKIQTKEKRMEEIETKLKFEIAMNDATKKLITKLRAKLEYERKKNAELRNQLNEKIRKTTSLEEEHKNKEEVVAQAKSNKDFSKIKIHSEVGNTNSDTKNQEIIFKVQIISSSARLAANSPQFKGLKIVWEYKDSGLYKYAVGNAKDLKSASVLQSEFRRKGFVGAFVVAFKNGKRIPVREALRLLN